jgi:hypothetical protein
MIMINKVAQNLWDKVVEFTMSMIENSGETHEG